VSVSLFFLIVALSRVSLRLISEISIDQELLFRYCCQYIISPAFMWITSARVETISLWQHRQKQGTNEEANCVKPSERAREMVRSPATRRDVREKLATSKPRLSPKGRAHLSACLAPLFCRISQSCAGAYAAEVLVLRLRLRWIIHPGVFISPLK